MSIPRFRQRYGVSVPATSANLGPGFDSFGVALDLRNDFFAELDSAGLALQRQVRQQEPAKGIEHLELAIGVGDNLAQETVHLHVAVELVAECATLLVIRHRSKAVDCRLQVA